MFPLRRDAEAVFYFLGYRVAVLVHLSGDHRPWRRYGGELACPQGNAEKGEDHGMNAVGQGSVGDTGPVRGLETVIDGMALKQTPGKRRDAGFRMVEIVRIGEIQPADGGDHRNGRQCRKNG